MKTFPDATNTRAVILGLPFDTLAEIDFIAFDRLSRKRQLVA